MVDVELQIQVRYNEVDRMGVVYHPRYFTWFEMARLEILRQIGVPYADLESLGLGLPVGRCEAEFLKPLRFGQWFRLLGTLEELPDAGLRFQYQILVEDVVHSTGSTQHRVVQSDTLEPVPLPARLREALSDLPSQGGGQPLVPVRDPASTRLERDCS